MREDLTIQRVREGIAKWGEKPVAERVADMVERGVIDKDGNVLLRMPIAPKKSRASTSIKPANGDPTSIKPGGKKKT